MGIKIFAGIVALVLMVPYLIAPVVKLKDVALGVVVLVGVVLMLVDLWHSFRKGD